MSAVNELQKELGELRDAGVTLFHSEICRKLPDAAQKAGIDCSQNQVKLLSGYQSWYSKCVRLVALILPERTADFVGAYEIPKGKKSFGYTDYTIKYYLLGASFPSHDFDTTTAFATQIQFQITILDAAIEIANSRLSDIQSLLQYEVFDSELHSAEALLKKGHLRAAGAVAGVVVESHLKAVITARAIKVTKKTPAIADYNDALKEAGAIAVPMWRFVQRLGDIRNLCVHSKDTEPTKEDVSDLIAGTRKIVAEIG